MKFRPLHDKVLIQRIDAPEKSPGGIIIPEVHREAPCEGRVVAIGAGSIQPDGSVRKLDVKKNDVVLFSKYAGTELVIDGEKYTLLAESECIAVKA